MLRIDLLGFPFFKKTEGLIVGGPVVHEIVPEQGFHRSDKSEVPDLQAEFRHIGFGVRYLRGCEQLFRPGGEDSGEPVPIGAESASH